MKKYLVPLLILSILTISCEKDLIKGSGSVITESRTVGPFDQIRGNGSAKVYIDYADTFSVEVRAYENLLSHYETRVSESGILTLGFEDDVRVSNDNTEVFITMPGLKAVTINGSGDVSLNGPFPALPSLDLEINGSGKIQGAEAASGQLKATISGSGSMDLLSLKADTAEISIAGSGTARVHVSRLLTVRISGSGDVYYSGDPTVSSSIQGSGNVTKL